MKHLFFILILLPFHLFGMDHITKEYPELTSFFESSEFKESITCHKLEVGHLYNNEIAAFNIEISKYGIKEKIILNTHHINRNLITAEELKYIICHELGHLNDKKIKRYYKFLAGFWLLDIGLGIWTLSSLWNKQWISFLKRISIQASFDLAYSLILMKLARNRETFADEYGLSITKNKAAAISALYKRKAINKHEPYRFTFLNKIRNLFADHPTEDARIAHINNL